MSIVNNNVCDPKNYTADLHNHFLVLRVIWPGGYTPSCLNCSIETIFAYRTYGEFKKQMVETHGVHGEWILETKDYPRLLVGNDECTLKDLNVSNHDTISLQHKDCAPFAFGYSSYYKI